MLETLLYLTQPLSTFVYALYVLEYMEVREEPVVKKMINLLGVTGSIAIAVRLVNLFYPLYFRFDAAGMYQRQPLYPLSSVYTILGGIITIGILIHFRRRIRLYQRIILLAFLLSPLIAMLANMIWNGLHPIYPAMMATLLIIYCVLNVDKNRERAVLEAELSIANMIQDSLLPNILPDSQKGKEYDLFATMDPAREVGGDFYDYFMVDDHTLAFLIADVSDKGVGAAMLMAVSKAMIKMRAQLGGRPGKVLADVDERMARDNDEMMFVTVWLGYLDLATGHVIAANAGHDFPAIWLAANDGGEKAGYCIDEETAHGTPIACCLGQPYPEISFDMKPGDRVFLYTDGVCDARDSNGAAYGTGRLLQALNANRSEDARTLCRRVKESVDDFAGNTPQFDDMTMLALTFESYM